ncbi:hypothetical protein N7536_002471 [Penicillium majusculum]|nr:hypothetical protein N7536_002471 [Penicillium majusculum]
MARQPEQLSPLDQRRSWKRQDNAPLRYVSAEDQGNLVVFDQELRWKDHVQQAMKRATKTTTC